MKKRIISILLIICLCVTLLPTIALAAETVESGQCGDNLTWTLTSDGVLTISGTGDMWDYAYYWPDYDHPTPWLEKYTNIMGANPPVQLKTLVIEEGVTHIGECAFMHCTDFTGSLTIPTTVTSIGNCAFVSCRSFTGSLHIPDGVTEIGNSAFNGCDGLDKIFFDGNAPTAGDTAFPENVEIYVPEGRAGWSAPDWNGYKTIWYTPENKQSENPSETVNTTYGSPWMPAYEDFVLDGGYLKCGQSFGTAMEPIVMLHDMDADGVPELLMTNGEDGRATRCAYIFTCENDTVQYLGIGPTDAFYIEDSDYTGIWGGFNASPEWNWMYYSKTGSKINSELVYSEVSSVAGSSIKQVTGDSALFNASQKEKTQIYGAVISEIRNIGWDAFVESALGGVLDDELSVPDTVKTLTIPFDSSHNVDLNWGWELFNKDASEYDHNLAMAGLLLSCAAYDGSEETENRLHMLGFDVFGSFYYNGDGEGNDEIHQPARTVAAKKVHINGCEKIIIAAVVRGTNTREDGLTDLSAGITGFLDAGENTMTSISRCFPMIQSKYNCELTKDNTIFFLTGHSLGGAVSGVLSYKVLDYANRENVFVYTFASPNYATVDNCESYKNVHNIIALGDLVPTVPWLKKRYGNDWYYDLQSCREEINKIYGGEDSVWNTLFYHDMKTYFACLLSGLPKNMGDGAVNPYSLSSIHCPVDITVFDENGAELGHTSGETVALSNGSTVLIYTDGDAKYVLAPTDVKYTIQFTAAGEGVMAYSQQVVDAFSSSILSSKDFINVELVDGKSMRAEVGGKAEVQDIQLFVVDKSGKAVAEIAPDGRETEVFGSNIIIVTAVAVSAALAAAGCVIWLYRKHRKYGQAATGAR